MKPYFFAIVLVLGPIGVAHADPTIDDHYAARALQENCFNAFVRVRQPGVITGSAFFVHAERLGEDEYDAFVVTAYHCVDDDDAEIVIETVNASSNHFEDVFSASLIAFNEETDIAVLRTSLPFRPATIALAPGLGPNLPCPSPCQTLFVTTRARPDSGSRETATLYKSSSPLRWLRGNQLSSNFFERG